MAKCGVAHGLGVSPLPLSHASTPVGVQWFTQFWRYLPRGSIRSYHLRVQFHKIAHPLQVLVRSPSYHLPTDRSEIPVNPSLGSINLLEELTELTEMFHLLCHQCSIKRYNPRTAWGFSGRSDSRESACSMGNPGSFPGSGRSPGGGHANPLQYSCLENSHGQRRLAGTGLQRVGHDWVTNQEQLDGGDAQKRHWVPCPPQESHSSHAYQPGSSPNLILLCFYGGFVTQSCMGAKLCLTLCDPMDCSPPGCYVHGISQAKILEWVAISFSRGFS